MSQDNHNTNWKKIDRNKWYKDMWREKEKRYHVNNDSDQKKTKDSLRNNNGKDDSDDSIGCLWYAIGAIIVGVIIAYNGLGDAIGVLFGF